MFIDDQNKTPEKFVTLQATWKGMRGEVVSDVVWTIIGVVLIYAANLIKCWLYYEYGATTFQEFNDAHGSLTLGEFVAGFAGMALALFGVVAIIANACCYIGRFYEVKQFAVINKASNLITKTTFAFPNSKTTSQIRFERVIQVDVDQGWFDQSLITGDVTIRMVTGMNADSEITTLKIPYLHDPLGCREKILAGLPEYSGLRVQVEKKPE